MTAERPTAVRHSVLMLMCTLAMITYIDRGLFPNAAGEVSKALGLSGISDLTLALTAFQLAYALFEVPTGWMGDVFGPRSTIIRIVLWWSFFIGITGLAGLEVAGVTLVGFTTLIVSRFLFGMGEAGAFPNITRSLYNWFPYAERATAQGVVWTCSRLMGGLTPIIYLLLVDKEALGLDWRGTFFGFAAVGVVWCVVFARLFRDRPEQHPGVNAAELALIRGDGVTAEPAHSGVPWGRMVRSPNLWALCGMYFCLNYGWYFNMYFLPDFLKGRLIVATPGADPTFSAKLFAMLVAGSPLLLGMAGCMLGGRLSDWHVRTTGDRVWGRRTYGMLGFGLASGSFVLILFGPQTALVFAVGIALAGFFNDLAMATCWATAQDIGRRHAAIVSGTMNMIGNLGAALTTFVTGRVVGSYLADANAASAAAGLDAQATAAAGEAARFAAYYVNFVLFAVAYFVGMLLWLRIDATKPVLPDEDGDTV